MNELDIDAAVVDIVLRLVRDEPHEPVIDAIEELLAAADDPAEVVLMLAGQAATLLRLVAQSERQTVALVADRYQRATLISRLEQEFEDDGS